MTFSLWRRTVGEWGLKGEQQRGERAVKRVFAGGTVIVRRLIYARTAITLLFGRILNIVLDPHFESQTISILSISLSGSYNMSCINHVVLIKQRECETARRHLITRNQRLRTVGQHTPRLHRDATLHHPTISPECRADPANKFICTQILSALAIKTLLAHERYK